MSKWRGLRELDGREELAQAPAASPGGPTPFFPKPRNPRHFGTIEGGRVYQALHIESKSVLDALCRVKKCRRGLGRGVGLGSVAGCFPPSTPPFWGRFGIPALDCRDFPRVPFLRFALGRRVGWCWRVGSRPRLGFLPLAPVAHLHIFEGLRRCSFRQVGTSLVRSFRTWRTFLAT